MSRYGRYGGWATDDRARALVAEANELTRAMVLLSAAVQQRRDAGRRRGGRRAA